VQQVEHLAPGDGDLSHPAGIGKDDIKGKVYFNSFGVVVDAEESHNRGIIAENRGVERQTLNVV
jgi:hypothetical protein